MDWKYLDWTYNAGPSGAINSNVCDMAKWLSMLMNNGTYQGQQIISEDNTRYMLTPETVVTDPEMKANYWPMPIDYYCLGWRYGEYHPGPIIWHTGGTSGHTAIVAFAPQSKVGIVVFVNRFDKVPAILAKKFMDMYFENPGQDYLDQEVKEEAAASSSGNDSQTASQAQHSAPLPYESYVGNYTNDIYGNLRVFVDNGSLAMVLGPRSTEIILKPYNRDAFLMSFPDFPEFDGFATFQIGPEGGAEGLKIEMGGLLDASFETI
jgi:CubicO group peptidase (beta-lactamase class C family)